MRRAVRYLIKIYKEFTAEIKEDCVSAFASQSAYFIMLSFIPFLVLLMTAVRHTAVTKSDVLYWIQQLFPMSLNSFVINVVEEVYSSSFMTVSVSAVATLWSAGKGFMALMSGMNKIYHVDEHRNYLMLRLRGAVYTLLFVILIIVSLLLLVFGNSIHSMVVQYAPFFGIVTGMIMSMKNLISLGVFTCLFVILYRFIPDRKATLKSQLPGAVFTAVGWSVFSYFFSLYIDYYRGISIVYGNLTTVVLLMLWLYICMYILLLGAELNAYYEEPFREIKRAAWKLRQERKIREKEEKKGKKQDGKN